MSELQSQLGPDEEVALRRVALGFSHGVAPGHLRRLKDLRLIEADKTSWRLTALGQQRFKSLPRAAKLANHAHHITVTEQERWARRRAPLPTLRVAQSRNAQAALVFMTGYQQGTVQACNTFGAGAL